MMVFVPLPVASVLALRDGGAVAGRGFAGTPSLRRTLGPTSDDEEADFAALNAAGVAALDGQVDGQRLVLAAAVGPAQVRDRSTAFGEVALVELTWDQVRAVFADEEMAAAAVATAAAAARGVPLEAAFDLPAVVELTDTHDLLWYAPEELELLR